MELMPFYFEQQQVRVIRGEDGEPWFVAADVCGILGLSNAREALSGLDGDERSTVRITDGGPERNIISEPGLYALVLRSRKPAARKFSRWVRHAVLPEIRRTGSFTGNRDRLPTHLETAEALVEALKANEKLERQIVAQQPKVAFHDAVERADGQFTVGEAAQQLGTGEKRLFAMLRNRGFLKTNNAPYQEFIERGWFRVVTKTGTWGGREQVYRQTTITGKGLTGLFAALRDLLPAVHQPSLPGVDQQTLLN